jgi:hypothetical protein
MQVGFAMIGKVLLANFTECTLTSSSVFTFRYIMVAAGVAYDVILPPPGFGFPSEWYYLVKGVRKCELGWISNGITCGPKIVNFPPVTKNNEIRNMDIVSESCSSVFIRSG